MRPPQAGKQRFGQRPIMRTALTAPALTVIYRGLPPMATNCAATMTIKAILTFSWRMPLIQTNSGDTNLRSRWGDGCSVGTQLLWPRTEVRKRASLSGQGFLAFGPLVVAEVRTE